MGGTKLCLLLLVGTYALAQQDVESAADSPVCLLAKRYKNSRRFVYNYEAETLNGVNGATDNKSGPKISCKVAVDVPQTCSFVLRATECSLKEVFDVDGDGNPVYRPAAGAKAFREAMAKNPLKFTVDGQKRVKLYPEDDEPVNILNVKRGVVSALMVPAMEEDKNDNMPTVHGVCPTEYTVNAREDIATDVSVSRDLSGCDWFSAHSQDVSPLAIINGLNYPLSKVISSTQTCNYKFDNHKKHMTKGTCTEKHIFLPFSSQNEYGISTVVKQTVTLQETSKINDRVFNHNEDNIKFLHMEAFEAKSAVQNKNAAIETLMQLNMLPQTTKGEERASLFHRLVSEMRGLKLDALETAVAEMMDLSKPLSWQALVQCGTMECMTTLLKELRRLPPSLLDLDAAVYALGLLPNPSPMMVKEMLLIAQQKQSKPIMFALGNVVRKVYQVKGITPEITAVSELISSFLATDCAGDKDLTFLTLRVAGNIGDVLEAVDPSIKNTLVKCMRQPATTLAVQLAAIQAFRRMSVTDEVRKDLQRVCQYPKGAVQKRLAAYLMLMKNPVDSDFDMVSKMLKQEQNEQIKSFVSSHVYNIITSTDAEAQTVAKKLMDVLKDTEVLTHSDYTSKSRNYKLGVAYEDMQAGVQGSLFFDPSSKLPREVLLETTLKAFGFSMDVWEVGMQGKDFEPTIEALFGRNGFFPDTLSKVLYWAVDKVPQLEKWIRISEKHKVQDSLMREIVNNFNKVVKSLQRQEAPEAMAYLRFMGNELGYIKGSDLKVMADKAVMYADILMRVIPSKVMANLMSSTNNEIFAHYIFMDNKFILPTASGLPLTFALTGTFTPGAKGGLNFAPKEKELSFMPSVGVEFVTQMGVHVPEFVASTVEMHTSMYHESAFNAKITMDKSQVKLSIPAPQAKTRIFSISNKVFIVGGGFAHLIPHNLGDVTCRRLFSGVNYCTKKLQKDINDMSAAPYFPLNGETKFAVDISPSKEVTEYTATIAYKLLNEGKDGEQKVDSLSLALRAEGTLPTEASATMKYNRNMNVFTTQIMIPDIDVEAGVKVGVTDSISEGKSLLIEISNKNVPQLSLIGRAKLQAMTDGMLQLQMLVPKLKTDATLTATMSKTDGLTLEIKSDVKLQESSSVQAVTFKSGENHAEIQLRSNMNADTVALSFYTEACKEFVGVLLEDAMDQRVVSTDLKLRHIVNKAVEASNIWMEKLTSNCPYAKALRNKMADVEMPALPENLFMKFESSVKYHFNQDTLELSIPLPLGGKSSKELRVPPTVTTPRIFVPQVGMEVASKEIQIPTFTIPSEYDLTVPLMGMMEVSTKVNSNYYNLDARLSAGNNTVDSSSYEAKFTVVAESPIEILAFSAEGVTKVTDTEKVTKFTIDGSLKHMFISTGLNVLETFAVTDSLMSTGKYKVHATSPLGLDTSLEITTQLSLDSSKLSGDINTDGHLSAGPMTATTTYLQTFSVEPLKGEAMLDSNLRVNSEVLKLGNKIKASYAKDELMAEWSANMITDFLKHTTKTSMNYKDVKLTIHSDSVTKADERMLRSQVEFSAFEGQVSIRIENQADDTVNRAYSLFTGSLNPSGLEINTDGSVTIFSSLASHKSTLTLDINGLTASCTTTAQHSSMTFENIFHGGVDVSGATMSLSTKGAMKENKAQLTVEGKLASTEIYLNSIVNGNFYDMNTRNRVNFKLNEEGLLYSSSIVGSLNKMRTENTNSLSVTLRSFNLHSKTDNFLNMKNSYMHDITVTMEPYTASVIVKNDLKIMDVNFVNDAVVNVKPYTVELTGTTMGVLAEEQLKHTYEVKFVDMVLSAKCNTNGKLLGAHMSHTTDMEVAGLNIQFNNVANFNSPNLRLDSKIKTHVAPFTLNIDANFNSDGAVYLYGQQSGEVYSKFLLKAEPMLFTHSLEYRASTSHHLEGSPIIKTTMNNKFNSLLSLQEQRVSVKMTSKVNEHAFDQEMSAYNSLEKMGVEMMGGVSTAFFSDTSENYAVSGFVKYDKRSDSHFIQIPFLEELPELIEQAKFTMMRLMDYSMEALNDINTKYEISVKIQSKVSDLKKVVDNFDFNIFVKDLKKFINSVQNYVVNLAAKFPTDKVINMLKSIKEAIMAGIKKHNLSYRFGVIYAKVEETLSKYEVEKMIEAIMEEVLKIMKHYRLREHIQNFVRDLSNINIQPFFKQALVPLQEILNELSSFDYRQLIDGMTDYFMKVLQKIKSLDYNRFSAELKGIVVEMSKIPAFGKLYGEFRITSPHYNLITTADLENTTTASVTPEFKVNLNSRAQSTLTALDFTVDASAHVAAPRMRRLTISENVKVDQSSFNLDHKGTMNIYGLSAQASAETSAKADTEVYAADFGNKAFFAIENGVSAKMETNYKQKLSVPPLNIFSETSMNQKAVFVIEDSTARLTINNMADGKCTFEKSVAETAHKSDMDLVWDLHTAKLTFTGETSRNDFKMNQNVVADICIFRHAIIEAKVEVESPVVKRSIAEVKLQAKVEDLRIDFIATHNTELAGQFDGTISNSLSASAAPTELVFDTKNKGNVKIALPYSLSGKMDLQNDISCIVTSEVQQASWTGLARFNQYKYSHYFTVDNGEREISLFTRINGEANLDVLKEPITIPGMTLPFVGIKTPKVEDYSLWSDTGLSYILTTTQQTFDMNSKLKYLKNPEVITIDVNMEPFVNAINANVRSLHKKVLIGKDRAAAVMAESYNRAKAEYEKYSIELPKTITVPAYRVPVMNVEVSTFTIPVPDLSLITVPSLHIPSALSKLTLPKITLPKFTSIKIPVLGDLTYEFNMKTAVITLKCDASLLNQDKLVGKLDASSTSEFQLLNGKIEGSTSLDKFGGFKMVSLLAVKHSLLSGKHDSTIVLSFEDVATSISNSAKINLFQQSVEIHQEITGSPETGLLASMSTPSAGYVAVQMQTKSPAQLKARLFGRYPSLPSTDVEILAMKMSVMESKKLNLQTTWNTEMPFEMMLQVKKQVPVVTKMVSEPSVAMYRKMRRHANILGDSLEEATEQGRVMFKKAFDKLATAKPSLVMTTITENMIMITKGYQKRVEMMLNAVVKFLRDTKFQLPGYEKKLSGLEIYQKTSTFVAEVSEKAVRIIPEYISSVFRNVRDYISAIEFTLPGSKYVVRGSEILDDLFVAFKKIQDQVILTVRKIGNIQLEDIISKYSAFVQFTTGQMEKLAQTLKSQNADRLYAFVTETYHEFINCPLLGQVATQVKEVQKIVIEYLKAVGAKVHDMLSDINTEQLQADIQSQIDFLVKRANTLQNDTVKMFREKSKAVNSFVRVEDRQVEINIPLSFFLE